MRSSLSALYKLCFIVIVSFLFSFCTKTNSSSGTTATVVPPVVPPADTTGYTLAWSDEFNGSTLNTSVWNFETGNGGWGNQEQEYYQSANATVAGGNLVITAKKEMADTSHYTSARITTQGNQQFQYGKIEARIKIPVAQGLWPAFWLLGSSITTIGWPACGETDIMEHIDTDSIVYGTSHWLNAGNASSGGSTATSPSGYHIYALEWSADSIKWSVDSTVYFNLPLTQNGTAAFRQPFYIILNLAVGGDWPGQQIDDSMLPASMYVDWVRVYQKK